MQKLLVLLALAGCASTTDRDTIEGFLRVQLEQQRVAWDRRDASLMGGSPDIQRRMDMTTSIEEMSERIERIDVTGEEAVVLSSQRFVRTMRVEGKERQRISTVQHRRHLRRTTTGWKVEKLEELNPAAHWADE